MKQQISIEQGRPVAASPRQLLLKAIGLCKSFGGQTVLKDANVEIREGDIILVRGENGSGKTTILDILTGNLAPDSGSMHFFTETEEKVIVFPQGWVSAFKPFSCFSPEWVARNGRVAR